MARRDGRGLGGRQGRVPGARRSLGGVEVFRRHDPLLGQTLSAIELGASEARLDLALVTHGAGLRKARAGRLDASPRLGTAASVEGNGRGRREGRQDCPARLDCISLPELDPQHTPIDRRRDQEPVVDPGLSLVIEGDLQGSSGHLRKVHDYRLGPQQHHDQNGGHGSAAAPEKPSSASDESQHHYSRVLSTARRSRPLTRRRTLTAERPEAAISVRAERAYVCGATTRGNR